jgi:hypothetical protein
MAARRSEPAAKGQRTRRAKRLRDSQMAAAARNAAPWIRAVGGRGSSAATFGNSPKGVGTGVDL